MGETGAVCSSERAYWRKISGETSGFGTSWALGAGEDDLSLRSGGVRVGIVCDCDCDLRAWMAFLRYSDLGATEKPPDREAEDRGESGVAGRRSP